MYSIHIKEEAKQDTINATRWYRSKQEKLDIKFIEAVQYTLSSIQHNPFAYKKVHHHFRQATLKKFPYIILFEFEDNTVTVYAIFNTWQDVNKKMKRIHLKE